MNGTTFPQVASMQDLQRGYRRLIELVQKTKEPLYLLRNNKPKVVVLDLDRFNQVNEMARRTEELETLEAIRIYETEERAGKLKTAKSLKELI